MIMRNLAVAVLAVGALTLGAVAACESDPIVPQNDVFLATMTNAKEIPVPTVARNSAGTALITINPTRTSVVFSITTTGLDSVTAGHIHCCANLTTAAPVFVPLLAFPTPGVAQGTYSGTVSASLITSTALGAAPLDSLVKMIKAGQAYVNLHTVGAPGGEIRGQLQ